MQIERRIIESGLLSKGFVRGEETHHNYFHHIYQGKITGVYTYTSHRTKTYDAYLLNMIKKQLRLDRTKQVVDLCKCPITEDAYNQILINKGLFNP